MQRQIDKQAERKVAAYQGTVTIGGFNSTNFNANQSRNLTPTTSNAISIAQGTGQGDRIGNKISVKKATLKMTSWVLPYNAISNQVPTPFVMDVHIYTPKLALGPPSQSTLGNYFQFGDTSVAPTGNVVDLNYDANGDAYTEYKRVNFKLGYAAFVANPGGLGPNGYYSNNDSEMFDVRSIDLTPYFPKTIDWSDTTAAPYSKSVCMWLQCVAQDGTTNNSGTFSAQANYQVILEYTDA